MFKRIALFLLVNALVVFTLSIVLSFFNIRPYLTQHGLDYGSLMAFCAVWGMGGAFISLLLSKWMAKMAMGVTTIGEHETNPTLVHLRERVYTIAKDAGMRVMPEVGIFNHPAPNAFATGPSASYSLVALSTGLLQELNDEEVDAVIGHEITHITNGDMVTMTLLQGVVNAFVMFFARILAYVVSGLGKEGGKRGSYMSYYLFTILFEMVFLLLGSLVIAAYSRRREFKADKGGAYLTTKEQMIHALEALGNSKRANMKMAGEGKLDAFMIASRPRASLLTLFATHPSLEKRIEALKA